MRKLIAAALLASAASVGAIAYAQIEGPPIATATDARSHASDQEVGEARRYYRAQCQKHETAAFCECVTAGVAQALAPEEARLAARTIGERIGAEGDAPLAAETDLSPANASASERIEQVEAHYADACARFRR